jgi:IS1 family transposase
MYLQQVISFFFSKDNKANLSSLVGYFAEVEMKNESTSEVELYQVGSDIAESSKS